MKYRLYKKSKSGTYFFQFLDNQKSIVLQSQPYDNKVSRNAGLKSVFKNAGNAERYHPKELNDGSVYFSLFAENGEEIARSPAFTETLSSNYIEQCISEIPALSKIFHDETNDASSNPSIEHVTGNEYATDGKTDDYKRLAFYQELVNADSDGIQKIQKSDDFYFCCVKNGSVILISEAYESEESRDAGIVSLSQSLPMAERYQRNINDDGKYYFNLKSANGSEIGTSAWFETSEDLNNSINYLQGYSSGIEIKPETPVIVTPNLNDDYSVVDYLEIANRDLPNAEVVEIVEETAKEVITESDDQVVTYEEVVVPAEEPEEVIHDELVDELIEDEKQTIVEPEPILTPKKKPVKEKVQTRTYEDDKSGGLWKWLLPILLLPLLFLLFKTCSDPSNKSGSESTINNEQITPKKTEVKEIVKPERTEVKVETKKDVVDSDKTPIKKAEVPVVKRQTIQPKIVASSKISGANIVGKLKACLEDGNCKRPIKINWTGSQFGYNEHNISDSGLKELKEIAGLIKNQDNIKLEIHGHAAQNEDDSFVSKAAGVKSLSAMRAKVVYDALSKNGLNASAMSYSGKGDSDPISTDYIEPGFVLNKRIDLLIY